jgi:glycerate kinase
MRLRKTIKIDDKEYTIFELTVRQVWNLVNTDGAEGDLGSVEALLQASCSELTRDAAMDMAPSELDQIWEAFKEVNAVFLDLAKTAGLADVLIESIKNAVTTSIAQSASLSNQGTVA